jgi:hypothetical protein
LISRQKSNAAVAIGVFFLALVSREFFRFLPEPYGTVSWKVFWIALCLSVLFVTHGFSISKAIRELGLMKPVGRAVAFGAVVVLPMVVVFFATARISPHVSWSAVLKTSLLAPLSEEVLFRGYLFRQLYRNSGWTFFGAVLLSAGVFALAHMSVLLSKPGSAMELLSAVGMLAIGGVFFAWLLIRWDDNLWVPISVHAFMNFVCELFACDDSRINRSTTIARVLVVCAAAAIVLARRRRATRRAERAA